jgi:regulator of sigma E protease
MRSPRCRRGQRRSEAGDLILAIDGTPIEPWPSSTSSRASCRPPPVLDYTGANAMAGAQRRGSVSLSPLVQSVSPQSAAMDVGLREGDVIRAVDGTPISMPSAQLREAGDARAGAP